MILNSMRLNNLYTANKLAFQKRHKNRAKGHINNQKHETFININRFLDYNSDCFCRNTKNCPTCQMKQDMLYCDESHETLDIEDIKFLQSNPDLATLVDFGFDSIVDDLNKNGMSATGIHCIRYTKDSNDNFQVVISAVNDDELVENHQFSKDEFLKFMETIKNIKIKFALADFNKINSSYRSLKSNISKL